MDKKKSQKLRGERTILREKRMADATNDYVWARDKELMRLDAAEPVKVTFAEYFANYAEIIKVRNRKNRGFAIETSDGRHIGNCGYYNIDKIRKEAELGIMIGDREYWGKGYGSDVTLILLRYLFHDVGMERICLYTLEWNVRAQRCFEKCGFVPCARINKRGYDFIKMELYRHWIESE